MKKRITVSIATQRRTVCALAALSLTMNALTSTSSAESKELSQTESSIASPAKAEVEDQSQLDDAKDQKQEGVFSQIQAKARPFGLDITAPVMKSGSDAMSVSFQTAVLPSVTSLVNNRLSEQKWMNDSAMLLDPSKLKLKTDSDVRVYFIGEGAGYHNSLGVNLSGGGVKSGNPELLFPDASSAVSTYDPKQSSQRTSTNPLLPGDFVNLGRKSAGSTLNFFLIADGANGGKNVYSTDKSVNPDGINHVVSFAFAIPGSSLLIIGFEDLYGGGDRDFNDVIIGVDIGAGNVAALTATPEPSTYATLGSMILGTLWIKRRKDRESGSTKA